MAPPLADPLAFLQVQAGMQQGLDTAGEFAFVMLDPATIAGAQGPEDALLVLVPITDIKSFLANWPQAKSEGDVTAINIQGDTSYVAPWGKYAAISPNRAALAAKVSGSPGLTAPATTAKELSGKDIILFANMTSIRGKLLPEVQQGRQMILTQMQAALANEPQMAKFSAVIKAAMNQLMNAVETYLNEAQAATVGISLVPEGINATVMTEFSPGSYLGQLTTSMKGTEASMLNGLPAGKYLFYGGSVGDPASSNKLLSDLADPIVTELLAVGPEWAIVKEYADALKQYISATRTSTFGMVAPQGALGTEALFQIVALQGGDVQAMKDANTKMIAAQSKLVNLIQIPNAPAVAPVHTPNAKVIDSVQLDSLVTKIEMNPNEPMAMQQAQIMNLVYGPQGAVVYYGIAGDKMVVFSGLTEPVMASTIAAVKANSAVLSQESGVQAVSNQLPKQRLGVLYVNVGEIATTSLNYARQFGLALPVMLPPDLPPIGVSVATESTAMRIDAHVPTVLVQSLIAAGLQAQMQMQGGPPPGGGL
jgi:hypothetical protein